MAHNSKSDQSVTSDPLTGKPLMTATPAATIIVVHDRASQPPDLLMVERSGKMAFAAGAAVFPGGRVDEGDIVLAEDMLSNSGDAEQLADMAGRIAAIRETIEESGIAVGLHKVPDGNAVAEMRAALLEGVAMPHLLKQFRLAIDPDALIAFTRWRPPFNEKRVFDTRFYLARYTGPKHAARVDATENRSLFWANARDTLNRADTGEVKVIFPTRRNLERLAQYGGFDALADHARAHPAVLITPFIEEREGQPHLCIPEGLGYPVTSEPIKGALRG